MTPRKLAAALQFKLRGFFGLHAGGNAGQALIEVSLAQSVFFSQAAALVGRIGGAHVEQS